MKIYYDFFKRRRKIRIGIKSENHNRYSVYTLAVQNDFTLGEAIEINEKAKNGTKNQN